jgi:hypothetical protein
MSSFRPALVVTLSLFAVALAAEQIPLGNWSVPPYRGMGTSSGLSTMADITSAVAFVGVAPCRLVDTRQAGFPAGYGQPALAGGVPRNFDLNSQPNCTGIPAGVEAYSLNVTVTNTQGPGFILVYAQGGAQPDVSTLNYVAGQTIANAAVVPAGTGGGVTVVAGVSGADLIVDINGYFTADQNPGQSFVARSSTAEPAIIGENTSDALGAVAVRGLVSSTTALLTASTAVEGINMGQGFGYGVRGAHNGSGIGVYGTSDGGIAVLGSSPRIGMRAESTGLAPGFPGYGLLAASQSSVDFSAAIRADAFASSGRVYAIDAFSASQTPDSAGLRAAASFANIATLLPKAGVRGESYDGYGVIGIGNSNAIIGLLTDGPTGDTIATGQLGTNFGSDPGSGSPPWGVFAQGDIGASGAKHFVDPHPTDASKAISYVSLEGPEAGTYFRGRGQFQNGMARITVPEHFRLVTAPDGLSVQVTPIGAMATVAVMKFDLEEIVVESSRNVEFFYVVQGVRATFREVEPVMSSAPFLPQTADARMPGYLSEEQKRRLIENGTYRSDGTVNIETARRLGWDRMWEKKAEPRTTLPRE